MRHIATLTLAAVMATNNAEAAPLENRVFRVLESRPPARSDTDLGSRRTARLRQAARAIAKVSKTREDAAALITLGEFESHFAEYVAAGCMLVPAKSPDCDRGKSRSYWQVKQWCKAAWVYHRGDPRALEHFARCAIQHWHYAKRRCGTVQGAFSGYRDVQCDWPAAKKRAARYAETLARL